MQEISSRTTPITQTDKARQGDIVLYWTDNRKATQRWAGSLNTDLRTGFRLASLNGFEKSEAELRSRYCFFE